MQCAQPAPPTGQAQVALLRAGVRTRQSTRCGTGGYHPSGRTVSLSFMLEVQSALTQMATGWSHVRYWLIWCDSREDTVLHLHGDHCAAIILGKCDGDDLQYVGR